MSRFDDFFRLVAVVDEGMLSAAAERRWGAAAVVAPKIASTKINCCVAPRYLNERGEPVQPSELTEHHCLVPRQHGLNSHWIFHRAKPRDSVKVGDSIQSDVGWGHYQCNG